MVTLMTSVPLKILSSIWVTAAPSISDGMITSSCTASGTHPMTERVPSSFVS